MDHDYIRNYLLEKGVTAYEISKATGLSTSGMDYFLNGDSKPRRKTLEKLEEFVNTFNEPNYTENTLKEPNAIYKSITNEDIYKLIESLGTSLGSNAKLVSEVLTSTLKNTKEILKNTEEIKWNYIKEANKNLKEEK